MIDFFLSPSLTINIYLIYAHTHYKLIGLQWNNRLILTVSRANRSQTTNNTSRQCPTQSHQIFILCSWHEYSVDRRVDRRNVKRNWCQQHKRICICHNYGSDVIAHQIVLDCDCFCSCSTLQLSYQITQSDLKLVPIHWHQMPALQNYNFQFSMGDSVRTQSCVIVCVTIHFVAIISKLCWENVSH